jgi:glycogen phosphorylase
MPLMNESRHPYLRPLPPSLADLGDLSLDLRWTWSHSADLLWQTLDPEVWAHTRNPWLILQGVATHRLDELARDDAFLAELGRLVDARRHYLARPTWFERAHPDAALQVAYFSMEYGLAEALPIYSGGLGVLAGDHLKTASDLGVPVVGVGLLYQEGYFRQMLDECGRQLEFHPHNVPMNLPITPVRNHDGVPLRVPFQLPGRVLHLHVWQAQIGRAKLLLLDSNDAMNSPADRAITGRLYGGGAETRLAQEIVLGVGGWRALQAIGVEPDVCHLNEGHAAFVTLARAQHFMERHGADFWEALWATRAGNVFTTHTPVAAAFDTYPPSLLAKYGRGYADALGIAPGQLLALGRRNPRDENEPFNMAYLAARTCIGTNAVSRLHGEVSRRIFQDLYPRWPEREVPVTHVTNGVHVPSWDSNWADEIWTETCGKERWLGTVDPLLRAVSGASDEALWQLRGKQRNDLVHYARHRLAHQLGEQGADVSTIFRARTVLDPNALTLGFARRFTEYKRPNMLLHDPDRLARLLTDHDRPVQLIIAGKAHPRDDEGKRYIEAWVNFVHRPDVRSRAVFLEDYDLRLAQELVQGVDVWINTPRRPWEACGTSGMKVLVNGGLNVSELDGWWAEAYSPEVGWALGDGNEHRDGSYDAIEAEALYRMLEQDIVPMFYARDPAGLSRAWVQRMRASMAQLAPRFSSVRMLQEYVRDGYLPAAAAYRRRTADEGRVGRELAAWAARLRRHWQDIRMADLVATREQHGWRFALQVYLGDIAADEVEVELFAEPAGGEAIERLTMRRQADIRGATNAYVYGCSVATDRPAEDFTPRVLPRHPEARVPTELNLISWWPRS